MNSSTKLKLLRHTVSWTDQLLDSWLPYLETAIIGLPMPQPIKFSIKIHTHTHHMHACIDNTHIYDVCMSLDGYTNVGGKTT